MWSGGKEESENGEAVLLMQPKKTKKTKNIDSNTVIGDPNKSFIGGKPFFHSQDSELKKNLFGGEAGGEITCDICHSDMFLLCQVNTPLTNLDRTLLVFGCNNVDCAYHVCSSASKTFSNNSNVNNPFFLGGGVFRCIRSQSQHQESSSSPIAATTDINSNNVNTKWGDDEDDDNGSDGGWGNDNDSNDDDWGGNNTTKNSTTNKMEELEAMLKDCEMNNYDNIRKEEESNNKKDLQYDDMKLSSKKIDSSFSSLNKNCFPEYDLELFDEPYPMGRRKKYNVTSSGLDDDEDDEFGYEDVGAGEDSSIQNILSKYLQEEQDADILAALQKQKQSSSSVTTTSEGRATAADGEKYEKVPPVQRAFLTFQDRMKRAPRQSVRYAYGGQPLWSRPTVTTNAATLVNNKNNKGRGRGGGPRRVSLVPDIPPCKGCGSKRYFEFQLMPSILFDLKVDDFANGGGGMDWDVLAIYSCAKSCDQSREEIVVVQQTSSTNPTSTTVMSTNNNDGKSNVSQLRSSPQGEEDVYDPKNNEHASYDEDEEDMEIVKD